MRPSRIILFVIIALVAGAAWLLHWSRHAVRESALVAADMASLRQIGLACREYAEQHQGQYPPDWTVLTNELGAGKIFVCYHDRARVGAMSNVMAWTSYDYVRGVTTASPPGTVVAYFRPRRYGKHTGGLILFADGTVVGVNPEEFQRMMSEPSTNRLAGARPGTWPFGKGYD